MNRKLTVALLALVVLILVVAGVAWAAGESAQRPAPAAARAGEPAGPAPALAGLGRNAVRGTVTAVAGKIVSVETKTGERATLVLTDTTVLWLPGEPPTRTITLEAGDPVLALGRPAADADGEWALLARVIVVASDEELPRVLIAGRVVAVTRQTVVVGVGQRERALTVLPRTRFWSPGGGPKSINDLRPGDRIAALGQPVEVGGWVAGLVLVPGAGAGETRRRAGP